VVILHTAAQIAAMRKAGQLVAKTFAHLMPLVVPGVSTHALDSAAEQFIRANGATPAYKGYLGFPATICVAPNSVICHGIPSPTSILHDGDIIGLDIGVILDGWYGDACITVPVGTISSAAQRLLDVTAECLRRGIAAATVGNTLGDIGAAIQRHAEAHGYSVVREYTGHGVGQRLHQEPTVHHVGKAKSGMALKEGMIFTIEPMINAGTHKAILDKKDKWTVRTADGNLSAQFEHTIAITATGAQILTLP
jgi:methionyl aminopeptidase